MTVSRRDFIRSAVAAGAWGASCRLDAAPQGAIDGAHPNLVIVFPDQMRGSAIGCLGEEPVLTPVLDGFAKESVLFRQAVSNYPLCSPFRGMLWTGKYPLATGVIENATSQARAYGCELKATETCLSDVLKRRGYSLGYIGKWHLDAPYKPYVNSSNNRAEPAWNEWTPPDRRHGFDFWHAYGTYDQHLRPMYWSTDAPRDGAVYVDEWGPIHEARLAARYIRNEGGRYRAEGKPFTLVVSMNPPHMPYDQVPGNYLDLYRGADPEKLFRRPNIPAAGSRWGDYYRNNLRGYYAMISGVDEQFGLILKALTDAGLARNTIVVFASDHGNCLGIHDEISKNNPYEESMRIPLLLRWPGHIRPRRDDTLISVPDLMPSLLDLLGFANDIPPSVQGVSFKDRILKGTGPQPGSQFYLRIAGGKTAYALRGVRTSRHTLVISRAESGTPEITLYDNREDPFQMKNIAGSSPAIVRRLANEQLAPWLKKIRDPWQMPA
jgi:arylsulfatase A-like enzyme